MEVSLEPPPSLPPFCPGSEVREDTPGHLPGLPPFCPLELRIAAWDDAPVLPPLCPLEVSSGLPPFCPLELRSAGILQPSVATPGRHTPRNTFRERPSTAAAAAAVGSASGSAASAEGGAKQSFRELDFLPPVRSHIARTQSLPTPNQVGPIDPLIQALKAGSHNAGVVSGVPDSPLFSRLRAVTVTGRGHSVMSSSSSSGKLTPSLAPVSERIWELAYSGEEVTEEREGRPRGKGKSGGLKASMVGGSFRRATTVGGERRGGRITQGGGSARQERKGEPRTDSCGRRVVIDGDTVPSTGTSPSTVTGSRRSGRLRRPQRTSSCPKQLRMALSSPLGSTSSQLRCLHPTAADHDQAGAETDSPATLLETLSGPLSFSGEGRSRVFARAWASFQERPQVGPTTTPRPPRPSTSISVSKESPREDELLFGGTSTPGRRLSRLPGRRWIAGDTWTRPEPYAACPELADQRPEIGGSRHHLWVNQSNHTKTGCPQEDMAALGLYTPRWGPQGGKELPWRMALMEGGHPLLTSADVEVVGRGQSAMSGDVVGDIEYGLAFGGELRVTRTQSSRVLRVSSCTAASETGYSGPGVLGGDRLSPTRFLESWGVDHQEFVFPLVPEQSLTDQCACDMLPEHARHAKRHAMSEIPEGFLDSIDMKQQHAAVSTSYAQGVSVVGQASHLEGGKGNLGRGDKRQPPPPEARKAGKAVANQGVKTDLRSPNSSSSWRLYAPLPRLISSYGSQATDPRAAKGHTTKPGERHPTQAVEPSQVQRAPMRRSRTVCQQVLGSILGPKQHLGEDSGRAASSRDAPGKHLKQQCDSAAKLDGRKREAVASLRESLPGIDMVGEHAAPGETETGGLLRAHLRRLLRNRSDPVERATGKSKVIPAEKAAVQQAQELEVPQEEVGSSDSDDDSESGGEEGGSFVTLISFSNVSAPQHRRASSGIDSARIRFL